MLPPVGVLAFHLSIASRILPPLQSATGVSTAKAEQVAQTKWSAIVPLPKARPELSPMAEKRATIAGWFFGWQPMPWPGVLVPNHTFPRQHSSVSRLLVLKASLQAQGRLPPGFPEAENSALCAGRGRFFSQFQSVRERRRHARRPRPHQGPPGRHTPSQPIASTLKLFRRTRPPVPAGQASGRCTIQRHAHR